jgi:acid stress-induced BolA-like protein IbaG/YrbA
MAKTAEIKDIILSSLDDAEVHVHDPRSDGMHLEAVIISSRFENLSLLDQHRMVMESLKTHFDDQSLHALKLKTYSPKQWQKVKEKIYVK